MKGYDLQVQNLSRDNFVVEQGWAADSVLKKMVGLLKHRYLIKGEGMWFPGGSWIHSIGMKFPFDAVFMNRKKRVVKIVTHILPNRFLAPVWRASAVIELPSGGVMHCGVKVGDQLEIVRFKR